jgi:hypothetical protein
MRTLVVASVAALLSAALWYGALALLLDVAIWIALLLAVASAGLTFFAIAHDFARR